MRIDVIERVLKDEGCSCDCDGSHGEYGDCDYDDHDPCWACVIQAAVFRGYDLEEEIAAQRIPKASAP